MKQIYPLSIFGAPKLSLEYFTAFNDSTRFLYGIVPVVIGLAIVELVAHRHQQKNESTDLRDISASVLTGIGYLISTTLTKFFMFAALIAVYNFTPWRQELNWWMFIPCFIIHDFIAYWKHRISHHSRFWWSIHIPHHSSNHYNLWINFRQSWFEQVTTIFFLPLLLMGFHPVLYFVVHAVNPLFQSWVHTEHVGKLPRWIEYVFVTPDAHRVHHGRNEKYIDKNFGNTILLWDRMFGTYQPLDEKPEYGLTETIDTANVFQIVFKEIISIFKDVRRASTMKGKIKMLFGSPAEIARMKKAGK